ncbi:hypothetical protein [Methanoplanus limicola]|jgi:hypothetical protein|uniref:Uncharacterized protein n=1 Tax=Methanoplanus limicola DSM 2279 TaxID=937775 RepID=H1Z2Q1_9EURY|nr:hypothetical protein [Methanoplanus limicola]EHQ36454.1 hypothetical protein Metlim_2404 [Methanoplanus limicola DSM 2279]
MKLIHTVLLFTLLISALSIPVMAEDDIVITFSDLDFDKSTEILIYDGTGELVRETNTSGTVSLNQSYSYLFVFKPSEKTWFSDPFQSLEFLKIQMPTYVAYLIWIVAVIGLMAILVAVFGGRRR